jgi:hypothetical protein
MEFHEVCEAFPLLEAEEFNELVEDIRQHGQPEDIWTYKSKIIDGRNRSRACPAAGVKPRYREWDGQGSLADLVVSLNIKRRHLNAAQKAAVAKLQLQYEAEARERQKSLAVPAPLASAQCGLSTWQIFAPL